jgi:hypothetical protein
MFAIINRVTRRACGQADEVRGVVAVHLDWSQWSTADRRTGLGVRGKDFKAARHDLAALPVGPTVRAASRRSSCVVSGSEGLAGSEPRTACAVCVERFLEGCSASRGAASGERRGRFSRGERVRSGGLGVMRGDRGATGWRRTGGGGGRITRRANVGRRGEAIGRGVRTIIVQAVPVMNADLRSEGLARTFFGVLRARR